MENLLTQSLQPFDFLGVPNGIRTCVTALKGQKVKFCKQLMVAGFPSNPYFKPFPLIPLFPLFPLILLFSI
jgi:hypothetical protein